jgi:tetratricopeptide (TPR) repeat protein
MTHSHAQDCTCDQDPLSLARRWGLAVLFIGISLVLLRPFIVGQMLVRVTSYSASSSYSDVVRICKKIIAIDRDNKQALVSLGYAYMDLSRSDMAMPVFEKVLLLHPEDKGAASFELGKIYYSKGDFLKAIGYFQRVRNAGPRAAVLLDADILKYRHGTLGFRSLNSMKTLLRSLLECYKQTGDTARVAQTQKEYDLYKSRHSKILF